MHGKKQADPVETICDRMREELIPILYQVVQSDEIRFLNPAAIRCWDKNECVNTDCPAYGKEDIPCWYRVGTYCGGVVQGSFVEKCGGCRQCEVFKQTCPTMVEELGEALNHLLLSLREERKNARKQLKNIEHLNRELVSALENLDTRNREIQELVITDKLTGLYNRNYLLTSLEDEILRLQRGDDPFTVMMIDFDDFKSINDTYGHACGDTILASFGNMVRGIIRKHDRPCRYGGEEFVILLPNTDMTVAWILAERIKKTYAKEAFSVETGDGTKSVFLTLSIGLAPYQKETSAGALLEQADEAMYKAKSEGKNRVIRYGID